MKIIRLSLPAMAVATALLVGCASAPTPADYATERPVLDLRQYFNGELVAHGMFSDRSGKVVRRFVVQMTTNLVSPAVWVPLQTNVIGTNGQIRFTETNRTARFRFYRLLFP